jgi:glutamate-5-semialdehyde dehydrogenase
MMKPLPNRNSSTSVESLAHRARQAASELCVLPARNKNQALASVRSLYAARREEILAANRQDERESEGEVAAGRMSQALFRRLSLHGTKFDGMLRGLEDVERLEDPVGRVTLATCLDEGLELYRVTCPLGVVGVVFEARPDAAVQIAALALKSSNAVLLKGGKEAARSNAILVDLFREAITQVPGVPADAVQLLATREDVQAMLALDELIDLIIPRGSNELVRSIQAATRIPVLGHADGLCTVYVDRSADPEKARRVVLDSKTHYPAACNAAETLLVHREAAPRLLGGLGAALQAAGVELRADERAIKFLPGAKAATPEDFDTEFLDLVLAVKTVDTIEEAVEHINRHGSHHTDAIVTEDEAAAEYFLSRVDSASVYHNASTRFADGFRYGLGAEVGISTNRTHARGPVGLEGLVTYKYRLYGSGHAAAEYDPGKRPFRHERIEGGSLPSQRDP